MRLALLIASMLLLAGPASAEGLTIQLVNDGRQSVSSLSLFPVDQDGDFIEDNLGGTQEDIPAGGKARVVLGADCGPMLAVVTRADGSELRLNFDACSNRTLVVRD